MLDSGGPDDDLVGLPGTAVRTSADALAVLLDLVGPERSGPPALWFVLLDADGRTVPVVLPITDVPLRADIPSRATPAGGAGVRARLRRPGRLGGRRAGPSGRW